MVKNIKNISLASLLGINKTEEGNIIRERFEERDRKVYARNLTKSELVSLKTLDIAKKYTPYEVAEMEKAYDKFTFNRQPRTAKGKLEKVLKFLEWENDLPSIGSMNYYLENITESFSGFGKLVKKMIASDDSEIKTNYHFFRDVLTGVTRKLLEDYGVAPTSENKKTGHAGRKVDYEPIKVVPGITTNEIIDFLIEKEIAGQRVHEYAIVGGFDNARVAMEVASMTKNYSDAMKYVRRGFTSMDQVSAVSLEKLITLEKLFGFSEDSDMFIDQVKKLERFAFRYIRGKPERVDEMIAIGQKRGQDYLVAFNGSVNQTQEILKIAPKERPSAKSVQYARTVLKEQNFKDCIALAKEIDSTHKGVFQYKFKTKWEFLDFKKDYETTIKDFLSKTGEKPDKDGKTYRFNYDIVKAFKGDLRFFSDFSTDDKKNVEKVEKVMGFNTYKRLNVSRKKELIPALIDEGYTVAEMKKAFSSRNQIDGYGLNCIVEELKNDLPLSEMTEVSEITYYNNKMTLGYVISMLRTVPFKDMGLPYGLLNCLNAYNVEPQEFKAFINTLGTSKYQLTEEDKKTPMATKPTLDAISMMEDFEKFYDQNNKKNKQD